MKDKHYGTFKQTDLQDDIDRYVEEIKIRGFTVVENVLTADELAVTREKIDATYLLQEAETGAELLEAIEEKNALRCPLAYDEMFLEIATKSVILAIIERMIGNYFILNQQNVAISYPNQKHHQSSWHRDLPYQNFVISKPIAMNALFAIDEFSKDTGGTIAVPYTHKLETIPSQEYIDKHQVTLEAPAGAVVVFDSMLFHRAGFNKSQKIRRAINHIYTEPIIKQQIDLPEYLGPKYENDPSLKKFLGYETQVPKSVREWRENRAAKKGVKDLAKS